MTTIVVHSFEELPELVRASLLRGTDTPFGRTLLASAQSGRAVFSIGGGDGIGGTYAIEPRQAAPGEPPPPPPPPPTPDEVALVSELRALEAALESGNDASIEAAREAVQEREELIAIRKRLETLDP